MIRSLPAVLTLLALAILTLTVSARDKGSAGAVLRWAEGDPGCTFSAGDDGLYRYGLWTDDFGIVMAVDADEVRKASSRTEPAFAILLNIRYRGTNSLIIPTDQITLEFVKHTNDIHPALDPDALAATLRRDSAKLAEQANREISKHPGNAQSLLRERQKSIEEAMAFMRSNSLTSVELRPEKPEASGWVFFSAKGKWIGDWKKQEEFVLRIPAENRTVEFPFALPPAQDELILRRRD
jgi:hypothetical protein